MVIVRRGFLALILATSSIFATDPREVFFLRLLDVAMDIKKSSPNEIIRNTPNLLILGQASLESADGTSKLAKIYNNYFGMVGSNGFAKFHNMRESVQAYLKNLATNNAYKTYQSAILNGEKNPHKLIEYIAKPYAEDKNYAKKVKGRISEHFLTRFDFIPVPPKKDSVTMTQTLVNNNEMCVAENENFDINEALNIGQNSLKVFNESIQKQEDPL